MIRLWLTLFLAVSFPASAAPCPSPQTSSGWSQSFTNTTVVKSMIYDLDHQYLYTIFPTNQYYTYIPVPQNVAQAFTYSSSPDIFYQQQITKFHSALESENCSIILTEASSPILVR